jgi:mRNA-degrading endonuclease HigB of HigAB toxin-antitoxin module
MKKHSFSPNLLGIDQREALEKGKLNRVRLRQLVENISITKEGNRYPHTYFFSPPGLGKTFAVKNHLISSNTKYIQVSGNVSMFAFGIQLAVINYLNPHRECDEIFKTEVNCNTMKNVLDGDRVFTYEKSLSSQWSNLSVIQQEAILNFQGKGRMGFSVPTDNMVFVFTSNFKLPIDDDVRIAREKGQSKSVILAHKNAIRSRCRVADFDLNWVG